MENYTFLISFSFPIFKYILSSSKTINWFVIISKSVFDPLNY
jgi:hypothetical protein